MTGKCVVPYRLQTVASRYPLGVFTAMQRARREATFGVEKCIVGAHLLPSVWYGPSSL